MWRFIQGIEPPRKKTKSLEDKNEQDRHYDQSIRRRSFSTNWTKLFPWVQCSDIDNVNTDGDDGDATDGPKMYCTICLENPQASDPTSNFVTGCSNFRIASLKEHNKSKKHVSATLAAYVKSAKTETLPADKMLLTMNEAHFSRLKRLFLTTHALIKKGRPFSDFVWMTRLDRAKDVDIGDTYCNDKSCRTFAWYIAEAERQKLENVVKTSHFYSLMSDGTTDSSVTEVEIIYLRHASMGEVKTDFVGLVGLEKANAENIVNGILNEACQQLKLEEDELLSKLVGFGSDGANVMMGCRTGVATRLKNKQMDVLSSDSPILLAIHCFNHRLELGYKDIVSKVPFHQRISTLLEQIYIFYHYSSLNRSMLKRSCAALGIKFIVPPRVGGTRWLTHLRRGLESLWSNYPAIVEHCQQLQVGDNVKPDSKAKAKGFLELLLTPRFVLYGHLLTDVVLALSKLSLKFQGDEWYSAADMKYEIEAVCNKLESYKTRAGPFLRKVVHLLVTDETVESYYADCKLYQHGRLRGSEQNIYANRFDTDRQQLINDLKVSLENRFKDTKDGVLKSLSLAKIKSWPEIEDMNFGKQDVSILIDHFRPVLIKASVNAEEAEDEWVTLRGKIYSTTSFIERQNTVTMPSWAKLNVMYRSECPNILALVDLVLSIPASNAECERGFSQVKLIKSDWRSRLSQAAVRDLLRGTLQTPDIGNFDPADAISLWLKGGKYSRRPCIKPYGKCRKGTAIVADWDLEESDDTSQSDYSNSDTENEM